jgi:flavin reductase (DIM6/NTAB) family NADH-FMN oxidoreductase RutF
MRQFGALTLNVFSPILCSRYHDLPKEEDMYQLISKAISHGVYIITVRTKEKVNGMTAAWVSQVSFKPLLLQE